MSFFFKAAKPAVPAAPVSVPATLAPPATLHQSENGVVKHEGVNGIYLLLHQFKFKI